MITFILLLIFCSVLFIFGWQLARFVLNEKRKEALIPLAAVLGPGVYLFLLNLSSYLIPIQINFYLIAAVLILLSYFLSRLNQKNGKTEWSISKKWRGILFSSCFLIMLIIGAIVIRYVSYDEIGLDHHLALASTIAGGNFPVKAIFAPNFPSQNHYGFNLFTAAVSKITNLPIWFSYDFLHFIFVGVVFLLGFLLIRDFCQNNFKAYLASLIMIFGGSLDFLYAIKGFSPLYQKYILNLPVEAPFKFLDYMLRGVRAEGIGKIVIYQSELTSTSLGFALTIATVYLYFKAINSGKNWLKISLLAGIIFSFLALTFEVFFGALGAVLLIYPLIFRSRAVFKSSFLILFLGSIIAFLQGGIVTQAINQIIFNHTVTLNYSFLISARYLLNGLVLQDQNDFLPIFSPPFFLRWGWLFIFVIPAAIYFLKKYFRPGLFLILLIFIPFFLPLIVDAGIQQGAFSRVNYLTTLFWNLLFGLFLAELLLFFHKKWQRTLMIVLILAVVFQGLLYSVLFPIFPGLERDKPFLGSDFSKPSPAELEVFKWVKKHTAIKDYFFTFGEELQVTSRNAKFIMYTRRLAPTFYYEDTQYVPESTRNRGVLVSEVILYEGIIKECDPAALRALNYRYLYVNKYWPQDLEEKCLSQTGLDLELKFSEVGPNEVARIYLVK